MLMAAFDKVLRERKVISASETPLDIALVFHLLKKLVRVNKALLAILAAHSDVGLTQVS